MDAVWLVDYGHHLHAGLELSLKFCQRVDFDINILLSKSDCYGKGFIIMFLTIALALNDKLIKNTVRAHEGQGKMNRNERKL